MSLPASLLSPAGWPADLDLRLAAAADETALQTALYADRPAEAFGRHFRHSLRQQAKDRSFWLVAAAQQAPVAGVQLVRSGEVLEIANLAVRADRRGQGIGSRLVAVAAAVAAYGGQQLLEINVATDNQRALALYRRLGFRQQRLFFVPDGTWAVRLVRETEIEIETETEIETGRELGNG